jgi:[FeFe] hydrogenase H-cluster maturation GTPase HydF
MQQTPKGLRLHIGIFGRRNVGKSSIINSITAQAISIVSDIAGTTTDPVEKAMELQPIGPVLFVDTAGVDDVGALGQQRVEKTMRVVERVDVALLVTDAWQEYEQQLFDLFRGKSIPIIVVANKSDLGAADMVVRNAAGMGVKYCVATSTLTGEGIAELRRILIEAVPEDFVNAPSIVSDLVPPGELIMLVVPIDIEAPKGRLILPQVQTLREILDCDAYAMVVKERELGDALSRLRRPPALVITDSQEFLKVAADVPDDIPLTSFSILFSRFKGDLTSAVEGAMAIDRLKPGDRVLIAEGCTHHPTGEDIGRVKIPRWLEQYVGGSLEFSVFAGHDFPDDIDAYRLIIHCGACVLNRRLMLSRIERARQAGIPLTNYGLSIAYSLGIFARALKPFPYVYDLYRSLRNI